MSNWQYGSIGWDNSLVPNRRQAIIWTNADPVHRRIYAALGVGVSFKQRSVYMKVHLWTF